MLLVLHEVCPQIFEGVLGTVEQFGAKIAVGLHHHADPLDHDDHSTSKAWLVALNEQRWQAKQAYLVSQVQGYPYPSAQVGLDGEVD